MKTLTIDLESCYGIKKLETTLDFSTAKAIAVYAPNGSMKTSLAKTFHDIAGGVDSKDRIFPTRPCKRVVKDENGTDLHKNSVLVVRPYDEVDHTAKTSTLLVNPALRKEYEDLHAGIDAAKDAFLKALKEQSGSKKDLEKEISSTFTSSDDRFYTALNRITDEVAAQPDAPLADVPYDLSGVSTSFRYTLWVVASRLRNRNVRLRESCEWPPSRPTREFIAVAAFGGNSENRTRYAAPRRARAVTSGFASW